MRTLASYIHRLDFVQNHCSLKSTFAMMSPSKETTTNTVEPGVQSRAWKTRLWTRFPMLVLLSLFGVLVAMGLALLVLVLADGSVVDDWPVTPTVYLSLAATLANALLRFAFSECADLFWWSRLLSPSGTTLSELHTLWDLKHNAFSLLNFHRLKHQHQKRHIYFRSTSILVLALAINGPLLQRAVTVDLTTRASVHDGVKLPIRREPIWNSTSKGALFGLFQDEVTEVYAEMSQRSSSALSYPVCSLNATCTTDVTVAGFSWTCNKSERSLHYAPSLVPIWADGGYGKYCKSTGLNSNCSILDTCYQLGLLALDERPGDGSVPWVNETLPPSVLNYTSYVRRSVEEESLLFRQCNISTTFIELPISVTNGRMVTLREQPIAKTMGEEYRSSHGIEPIPSPGLDPLLMVNLLSGFIDAMRALYGGYILTYSTGRRMEINGPRQYINQSSVRITLSEAEEVAAMKFSCLDPVDDFFATLNDMSLRYAIKSIPSTPERIAWEERGFADALQGSEDIRHKIRRLMKTEFVKEQVVNGFREERTVAAYSANYLSAGVVVGVTYITTFLVLILLDGVFSSHGRQFSMSPLEIAKAFNAPLLDGLGSNLTGSELARQAPGDRIKYGEAIGKGKAWPLPHAGLDEDTASHPKQTASHNIIQQEDASRPSSTIVEPEDVERSVVLGEAEEQTRLLVDLAERVSQPSDHRYYS
jgi:hypothetical protein